jgi:hypothetical protein
MMIWGPWHHRDNAKHTWPGYDHTNAPAPAEHQKH